MLMRKNSYFLATVFAGAFLGELVVDNGIDALWEWNNKGVPFTNISNDVVQKLWKDVERKLLTEAEQ